ncbi:MAG: serine acetyltransferase [Christensenella sp.]|nr:serine acetyltransferase [Christensenella sp.]
MLQDWKENSAPQIARNIMNINKPNITDDTISGFGMKRKVAAFIDLVRSAMYPNIYDTSITKEQDLEQTVTKRIGEAAVLLDCMIAEVLVNQCRLENRRHTDCDKCREVAKKITVHFMNEVPGIVRLLNTDIIAAYNGDPAARSQEEVLLSYPGFEAVSIYRVAHSLYRIDIPLLPRIMTELAHSKTGIDIHPGASIDEYFFIDHGTGVVIGETCTIGKHVKIYQGVTLGARSFELDENGHPVKGVKRHPDIKDNVIIYSGATILGGDTVIGENCVIGGNVWLTHSVDADTTVYNTTPSPTLITK